jgi:hypothetical protein
LILDGTTPFLYTFHLIYPVHPLISHCELTHLPHGSSMMGSHHHLWLWDFIPGRTPSGAWSMSENHCRPSSWGVTWEISEIYPNILYIITCVYISISIYIYVHTMFYIPIMHKYNHYIDPNKSVISDFPQNFGASKGPSKGTAPRSPLLSPWFFALTGATFWHLPQNSGIFLYNSGINI